MIGIFDSGSGGLTVLRAIRDVLPSSDVLYFGDIANAPYGGKTREELSALTVDGIKLLHDHGATSIVSACNSVSASLAISLFDAFDIAPQHLIEMVGPTVSYWRGSDARIALCATEATVRSRIYQSGFRMIGMHAHAFAISDLAGAIERGEGSETIEAIIREATSEVDWSDYDVLILACTHYPLAMDIFRAILPAHVGVFDPAIAVAERVERQLWPREAGEGRAHFIISRESATFRALVDRIFPQEEHTIQVA